MWGEQQASIQTGTCSICPCSPCRLHLLPEGVVRTEWGVLLQGSTLCTLSYHARRGVRACAAWQHARFVCSDSPHSATSDNRVTENLSAGTVGKVGLATRRSDWERCQLTEPYQFKRTLASSCGVQCGPSMSLLDPFAFPFPALCKQHCVPGGN